ncbi:MAG: riboflavin synthase [Victivallaceae bacterium]|nr:riboflavin synthase [Victivallaceae bacterium]
MFTGLIQQTGILTGCGGGRLSLKTAPPFDAPEAGESVAVNGACLTLETWTADGEMVFHVLKETLKRTNLGKLAAGSLLNLERAMRNGERFGGHIVSGHVDATGRLIEKKRLPDGDYLLKIELPETIAPEVVSKGSVAVDGISLTVIDAADAWFTVALIPTTLTETAIGSRKIGEPLNLESDVLAKYVRGNPAASKPKSKGALTMEKLREEGFLE